MAPLRGRRAQAAGECFSGSHRHGGQLPVRDLPVDEVVAETTRAVADGADEIDLVIPWKAFAAVINRLSAR
jgi:hypothetical protein